MHNQQYTVVYSVAKAIVPKFPPKWRFGDETAKRYKPTEVPVRTQ